MSEWKPISEAPRDGTQFLGNAPNLECGVSIFYYKKGKILSAFNGKPLLSYIKQPTHFMPLPQPPANHTPMTNEGEEG